MMKIIKNPQDNELLPVKRTVKKQKILATSNSKCYWLFFGKW